MSLVPYDDSDDSDHEQHALEKQDDNEVTKTNIEPKRQRMVHTSLNIPLSKPIQGDWLCFVFLPLPLDSEALQLLQKCRKFLSKTCPKTVVPIDQPHISLTRPILLRNHECEGLLSGVKSALEDFRKRENNQTNRFLTAFTKFIILPSEDQSKSFWATEVGQGWGLIRQLTDCLDSTLNAKSFSRQYYKEARFHTSFAHIDTDDKVEFSTAEMNDILSKLEDRYGDRLRSCASIPISQVGITIGSRTHFLDL